MSDYSYARAGLFEERDFAAAPITTFRVTTNRSVDWRSKGAMSPVREQRPCASCTAFSLMAVFEAHHKSRAGEDIELAAPWVHACISQRACGDTHRMLALVDALTGAGRVPTQAEASAAGGACAIAGSFIVPKIVHLPDQGAIREHVYQRGPVAAVFSVTPEFFDGWRNDELYKPTGGFSDNHAMCISGFDDQGKFWRVKNSLGPDWSDDGGYLRIAYGACELGAFKYTAFGVS